MKSFAKEFLHDDFGGGPALFLAAFGKHPGWDDHMEDLGLETESLVAAKRLLYSQGIGGNLDSGAWERLSEGQRLPACDHVFAWRRGNQSIVGRMWPSHDGKKRARYPMVVCVQYCGATAEEAVQLLLPCLFQIEEACKGAKTAAEVRAIMDSAREQMRVAVGGASAGPQPPADLDAGELARILADLWVRFAPYLAGSYSSKKAADAMHYRLPSSTETAAESTLAWLQIAASQFDPDAPLLVLEPVHKQWVDLIAGEPRPQELFCLRASLEALPLSVEPATSENPELQQRARATVDAWLSQGGTLGGAPQQRKWFQFFGA
jgi:hypothetical protein